MYAITPLRHYATAPLRHYATAPLRHYAITPLRHYAITALRLYDSVYDIGMTVHIWRNGAMTLQSWTLHVTELNLTHWLGSRRIG